MMEREKQIAARVWELAEPVCTIAGRELVHVEYQRESGGRVLRLYVDKPGGVTLDDCADLSRQISDMLDVLLETEGPYHLEVSSPGVNRPLGKPADFVRFQGEQAEIRTGSAIGGKKRFRGMLEGVDEDGLTLRRQEGDVRIPFRDITRARLIR